MHRLSIILTVLALLAPPASTFAGQQTQAERDRQQAQSDRERTQREAQQEREREQREAQQERDRAQREAQRERDRAQWERQREQERRSGQRQTQTERISRSFNIGTEGEIDLGNIAGDIIVTRGGGNAASIEVLKTAEGPDPRDILPLVTVDFVERGNRVEIRTRYPDSDVLRSRNRRNINVDVAFTIVAPQNTRLTIKSISGDISVKDISGALTLESTSGSVTITNAGRMVAAKSISGNVEASDTRIDGTLEAGTISGAVRLRRTTVQSAKVTSVSGDVILEDVTSNRIEGQSISGTVVYSGELAPSGRYELSSHSGSVRVAITGKTGFQLEATSFSGSVTTEFPLTLTGGGRRGKSLRGTYGNGAAFLDLTAFSGSILITKR